MCGESLAGFAIHVDDDTVDVAYGDSTVNIFSPRNSGGQIEYLFVSHNDVVNRALLAGFVACGLLGDEGIVVEVVDFHCGTNLVEGVAGL